MRKVLAVCCSDIHLSHKPPPARASEPDWYAAMAFTLKQVDMLRRRYDVPLIVAGDVFHHWNEPAELINFALRCFPGSAYMIPGQHDLPYHNHEQVRRSAYYTLAVGGPAIEEITYGIPIPYSDELVLHGFPFGTELKPCGRRNPRQVHLAVVHAYAWSNRSDCYLGASDEQSVNAYRSKLTGYDAVVFGDNHIGWISDDKHWLNCGALMRRRADEMNYQPCVALLYNDATFERVPLDISGEKILPVVEASDNAKGGENLETFVTELEKLATNTLDFAAVLRQAISEAPKEVRQMCLRSLEAKS